MPSCPATNFGSIIDEKKRFFSQNIAPQWKTLRRATGEFLASVLQETNEFYLNVVKNWIKNQYRIPIVEQNVCMDVANGRIPEHLVDRIPASILSKIETENIPSNEKLYKIYSPNTGGPVEKKFSDFTPEEVKASITIHGINTIDDPVDIQPVRPVKTAYANSYRIEGEYLVLIVPSMDKEIRIKITRSIVEEMNAALKQ